MVARLRLDTLRQWMPVLTLVALCAIVGTITPQFLTVDSLLVLAADTATLFVLATGLTFVIMLGGIDLSIQSMASLASVIVALTIDQLGYGSFALAVAVGALAGLAGGLAHVKLRIPSFIATLAIGGVLAGTALVISQARSITLDEAQRGYAGLGQRLPASASRTRSSSAPSCCSAPTSLQSRTRFGRYSAAIGAGEAAAYASGVKVGRQKVLALTLSGAFAGLAGVILAGRLSSGSPTLANELLLPAIAAVVVGGTAITGGVGSIWRTADRCPDHLGGAHRHDLRRRQHLRAADRVRPAC